MKTIKTLNTPKTTKKKKYFGLLWLFLLSMGGGAILYLFVLSSGSHVKAQESETISQKMLQELQREQLILEQKRKQLEEYERNLKIFEAELEQRYNDYLLKDKELKAKEESFARKLEVKIVNRQTVEMYENIDPEQAAVLLKNLYSKDSKLAVLIMRKISGRKAGKILEAMLLIDKEISTQLAKDSLEFYKPQ